MAFMIFASQARSNFTTGLPEAEAIEGVFRETIAGKGYFIGPRARITRVAQLGVTENRYTNVAWPAQLEFDDQGYANAFANLLKSRLDSQLSTLGGTFGEWTVRATPFDPAVNGTLDWWLNGGTGGAGDTATRRSTDLMQQLGQNETLENASGPTNNEQRTPSVGVPGGGPGSALNDLVTLAEVGLVLAFVLAGAYYLGPAVRASSEAYAVRVQPNRQQMVRRNPRRRHNKRSKR